MASQTKFARAMRSCRAKMPKASGAAVFRCVKAAGGLTKPARKSGPVRAAGTPAQRAHRVRFGTAAKKCAPLKSKGMRAGCMKAALRKR